jgi:GNAT superfamily N-acetyltransferase
MRPEDLAALCRLHFASFALRSTRRFVRRAYYPTLLAQRSSGFGYVAARGTDLVGLSGAVHDDAAFHRALLALHPLECLVAALARLGRGRALEPRRAVRAEARLHFLAVTPSERGGGLGTRLALLSQQALREAGHACCWARIARGNDAWAGMHERLGFRRDPSRASPDGELEEYRLDFTATASWAHPSDFPSQPGPPRSAAVCRRS